ncbi:phosphate acyltransferase PlsX [Fimbriimonas ginsengisoli]|uniref:Phosphate acyltransferase n=1 Tax=Fimbriimonas ginsengisoli Gsoil 348 TaxID=661478 RepID=A0A068NPW5_FIMGI|nr:phosphate acyltransferase PlsX [Fimbriimonas ginsengisoli]AIE84810.1 Phosphate:acyl-ACP acyltransferase PlsX [Fimbriimonas ginsengisoli Gsoil 348]
MSIALDAMGGDNAPQAIVEGALQAAPDLRSTLYLVGDVAKLKPLLPPTLPSNIVLHHASQQVEMDDKPLDAYRKKKDSSLLVACRLVKEGKAEAMVSAGNTGAASATALLTWRQLPGVHRPAIASPLPNHHGGFVIVDAGASPDVDPEHLVEFAIMGRAYAQKLMGRPNPRVHLLNIGEEEGKGNIFARAVYQLLKKHDWFAGNIEGKGMYSQPCDVVVCDAFVGNIVLKTSEGLAELIVDTIRGQIPANPVVRSLYWPVKKVLAPLRPSMDYAEIGGSPLLGLNGLCTICHGRSSARAIRNALLKTQLAMENKLVDTIREAVQRDLGVTE